VAGKVTGPGGGLPPTPPVDAPKGPGEKAEIPAAGGPRFADRLAGAPPAQPAAAAGRTDTITADLAADLRAGRITPQAAIDKVIDRIVDRQLGAGAPPAVREQVRMALVDAVADDPLLGEKLKQLS
jgi:hypothetical protein